MLGKNRLYSRKEPEREAKLFIIFCEGKKTEPNYFQYFNGIASQIKIELIPHENGKHSPTGLYQTACKILLGDEENDVSTKYDLRNEDEVWFIVDTDDWGKKIGELREALLKHINWFIAQSNPCFEVWLYYHFENNKAEFEGIEISKNWKAYLQNSIGGFNSYKHPIFIQTAIANARQNFLIQDGQPTISNTEVFLLGEKILPLIKLEIDTALSVL